MKLNEIKQLIKSLLREIKISPDTMKKITGRRFIPKEFTVTNDLLQLIKAKTVANGKYIFIDNVTATKLNDKTSELRKYAIQSKGEANKNRMVILALVKYLNKDNVQPKLGGFLVPTLRVDNSGQPVIKNPYKQEEEV